MTALVARSANIYDKVVIGDVVGNGYRDVIGMSSRPFDVVVMIGVAKYFGELERLIETMPALLRRGRVNRDRGVLVFDVSVHPDTSVSNDAKDRDLYELNSDSTWRHTPSYVEMVLQTCGFVVETKELVSEGGKRMVYSVRMGDA
jgi:predicted TPR repeat methyltransferase